MGTSDLPFPYNAWSLMSEGPQAIVDNINPMLQNRGLAEVLAQNLQRQGGEANNMLAGQMQQNPQVGIQGMRMLDQRGLQQAQMQQAQGAGALNQARAGEQNAMTRLIQGGYNGIGSEGGLEGLKRASAIRSMDTAKIQAYEDRARYPSGWKDSALDKRYNESQKILEDFPKLVTLRSNFKNFEPTEPLSVLKMLNIFQRSIDDGIVRQEDANVIRSATGTGFDDLKAMAHQYIKEGTAFPEKMGIALMAALNDVVDERTNNLTTFSKTLEDFGTNQGWSEEARDRAIPYRGAIKDYERLAQAKPHTMANGTQVMVAPRDGGYDRVNPDTGAWLK